MRQCWQVSLGQWWAGPSVKWFTVGETVMTVVIMTVRPGRVVRGFTVDESHIDS